jgi:hypothetical protein
MTRKGLYLAPPAGSSCSATAFTSEVLSDLNTLIETDLNTKDLVLISSHDLGGGIFIDTSRVPTSAETAFVLKHIRRLFPSPQGVSIDAIKPSATSYLKLVDVPISPGLPKEWARLTSEVLKSALAISPAGIIIAANIKHRPRIMRVSAHSDSCIAWIDIHDSQNGATAAQLIGKHVRVGNSTCRITGAKPHPGSVVCTRCNRWGHHFTQCRSQSVRCALCGGPHCEANHTTMVKVDRVDHRHCLNCSSANRLRASDKRRKTNHTAMDPKCPFWRNRFDRDWLKRQFKRD